MSKKSVIGDPRERLLNEQALGLVNQVIARIHDGLSEDDVKISVLDYLRAVDTRLTLMNRLTEKERHVVEVRYFPAEWEKEDQPGDPGDSPASH